MKEFLESQNVYLNKTANHFKNLDRKIIDVKLKGKWSIKEVIGHLIDSASNNHQRFVRANFKDDLVFEGYDQDEWVKLQNYNTADWEELIDCWLKFNLVIINSLSNFTKEKLFVERSKHNLNIIAWKTVPGDEPVTLEYFIKDYFGHLGYHVNQIERIIASLQKNNKTKEDN